MNIEDIKSKAPLSANFYFNGDLFVSDCSESFLPTDTISVEQAPFKSMRCRVFKRQLTYSNPISEEWKRCYPMGKIVIGSSMEKVYYFKLKEGIYYLYERGRWVGFPDWVYGGLLKSL